MYAPAYHMTGLAREQCSHRPFLNEWTEERGQRCPNPQRGWCIQCHAPLCLDHMGRCTSDIRCRDTATAVDDRRREAQARVVQAALVEARRGWAASALAAGLVAALAAAEAHGP